MVARLFTTMAHHAHNVPQSHNVELFAGAMQALVLNTAKLHKLGWVNFWQSSSEFSWSTYPKNENVYIVYLLSPLTTTDFRISDGIRKVVNANIA